jgi:hypothetical protein
MMSYGHDKESLQQLESAASPERSVPRVVVAQIEAGDRAWPFDGL